MIATVNFLRILSVILFLIAGLFVYAYMPVTVDLWRGPTEYTIHREHFFYLIMGIFFGVNVLCWILLKILLPDLANKLGEEVAAWAAGLPFVLNVCLVLLVGFIGVFNNSTHIPPDNYEYLNFIGPLLILTWIIGLIYLVIRERQTT